MTDGIVVSPVRLTRVVSPWRRPVGVGSRGEPMIHTSPLPDVAIPEVPLTTFVFSNAKGRADKVAFIEGAS
jgi:hypothetical protein